MGIDTVNQWSCDKCPTATYSDHTDMIPVPPKDWIMVDVTEYEPAHVTGTDVNKVKLGPVRKVTRKVYCSVCKAGLIL